VYGYSPTSDNTVKTEYVFMEFMKGTKLTDVWMQLDEAHLASAPRQLVELESLIMLIPFPAGGSLRLYYVDDLEKVAEGRTGRCRSTASASASVQMSGCICGIRGGRSSM
jgi:hypothetical protein